MLISAINEQFNFAMSADTTMTEKKTLDPATMLVVLKNLYEELRSYRGKEFQTFVFTFSAVGAGLFPSVGTVVLVKVILTALGSIMFYYLLRNHRRMLTLKKEIVAIQEKMGIDEDFFHYLKPHQWVEKTFESHLGTSTYVTVIAAETLMLWVPVLKAGIQTTGN